MNQLFSAQDIEYWNEFYGPAPLPVGIFPGNAGGPGMPNPGYPGAQVGNDNGWIINPIFYNAYLEYLNRQQQQPQYQQEQLVEINDGERIDENEDEAVVDEQQQNQHEAMMEINGGEHPMIHGLEDEAVFNGEEVIDGNVEIPIEEQDERGALAIGYEPHVERPISRGSSAGMSDGDLADDEFEDDLDEDMDNDLDNDEEMENEETDASGISILSQGDQDHQAAAEPDIVDGYAWLLERFRELLFGNPPPPPNNQAVIEVELENEDDPEDRNRWMLRQFEYLLFSKQPSAEEKNALIEKRRRLNRNPDSPLPSSSSDEAVEQSDEE